MKLKRHVERLSAVSVVAIATLALAGCSSDNRSTAVSAAPVPAGSSKPAQCGGKASLRAEGSTSQENAIAEFNKVWAQTCPGKTIAYNATGSGAGINQFIANQVDFAGSSSAMTGEQIGKAAQRCGGNPAWHLPLVFGPVALVYNVGDGVHDLVLNAAVLADIFQGRITRWSDPAIAALNSTSKLPNLAIAPIFRSDSSGTTDNFQAYLGAAAPTHWSKGAGTEFQGGVGEGVSKSSGVVQAVAVTPGSIGYVEISPAAGAGLPFARIDNGDGPAALKDDTVGKAIAAARLGDGNDLVIDLKSMYATKDAGAYPLIMATYEVVCSKGYDHDTAAAVKSFLSTAINQGQSNLSNIGYVRLPDELNKRVQTAISAID